MVRSVERRRVGVDRHPGVFGQMRRQVVQGPRGGEFLADLGERRISRIAAGTTVARERAVAGVQMYDHVTVIVVLACLEDQFPAVGFEALHDPTVGPVACEQQGRTSPSDRPLTMIDFDNPRST